MFTQDESYIKWKLFLEGDDQAYSWIYIITSKCSIIMAYKSLLILK